MEEFGVQFTEKPINVDPTSSVAVSVTRVPITKEAEHVGSQLIPPVSLVTVPVPIPDLVTIRVNI